MTLTGLNGVLYFGEDRVDHFPSLLWTTTGDPGEWKSVCVQVGVEDR